MDRKRNLLGCFLILAGTMGGGISACMIEAIFTAHPDLSALWVLSVRMILAGGLMVLVAFARGGRHSFDFLKDKATLFYFFLFAMSGMLLSQYGYFEAVRWSNASTATVLKATAAVFVLLIVCIANRRLPRWVETAAIGICVAGTWLMATHGDLSGMQMDPRALVFGLAGAFCSGYYTTITARVMQGNDPWAVVGGAIFFSGVVFCVVSPPWATSVVWTADLVINMAGVTFFGTIWGYMLALIGISMVGPVTGIVLAKNETIVSILLSVIVLKRRFLPVDYLGFAMVLGAVIMISVSSAKAPAKQ